MSTHNVCFHGEMRKISICFLSGAPQTAFTLNIRTDKPEQIV